MAISKIIYISDRKGETSGHHFQEVFDYIRKDEKTQNKVMVGAVNCLPDFALSQMKQTKQNFGKTEGRQAYHLIISFNEGETTAETAFEIVGKFVEMYLGARYEAVYSVHDDTDHIHGHILFNSVSFIDGKKFRYKKGDWEKDIFPLVNELCEEHGLKTLELDSKENRKRYREWNEYRDGKFVWNTMIRRDVDACILQSDSFEEFQQMMIDKGYEFKYGKHIAVKLPGMERVRRLYKLGDNYSEERIRVRIENETIRSFTRKPVIAQPRIVGIRYRRFKRAKLSGLQKKYFAKLYRLGKLKKRPYSKAWQYREDIKKMHQLQQQYLFLARNKIHTKEEMMLLWEKLSITRKKSSNERRKVYRERYPFKELFVKLEQLEQLKECEECYREGDDFFKDEHEEYQLLENEIKEEGYTIKEVIELKKHFDKAIADAKIREKEIYKEFRLADSIVKDIEREIRQKENEIKQQTESKNKSQELSEQPPIW